MVVPEEHVSLVKDYRSKVEVELFDVCASILNLLDAHPIPSANAIDSKVFYLKMKGSHYRYLAEFKIGDERKKAAEETMSASKSAQGSAHTGPALTPVEVLVAIHDISSEKDGVPLKKVDFLSRCMFFNTEYILN